MTHSTQEADYTTGRAAPEKIRKLVENAREQGALDGIDGKRTTPRFLAAFSLDVAPDPSQPHRTTSVKMHNVSEGGLAFWSRQRMPLYRRLFVRTFNSDGPTEWLPAHVRHCTRGIMGYLIGVEFE